MNEHPSGAKLRQWLFDQVSDSDDRAIGEHVRSCALVCQPFLDHFSSFTPPLMEPTMEVCESTLPVGTTIGDYEVLAEIDRGGMGVVYQAWSCNLHRVVALKLLDARDRYHPKRLARFQTEIDASARLSHPNIIAVHDAGKLDEMPFLVMEFAEHGTLESKVSKLAISPLKAANLVKLLARAVDFAHRHGVIHRDLKPQNILLCSLDSCKSTALDCPEWAIAFEDCLVVPKIGDFGLAKLAEESPGEPQGPLTSVDDRIGTPSYMAPEQVRGAPAQIGAATDIYALGAILYRLLVGKPPFVGANRQETFELILRAEPELPSRPIAIEPRGLKNICLKCLEKEPENRYTKASELADDLESFLQGNPVRARGSHSVRRLARRVVRHRTAIALTACVALLLAVIINWTNFLAVISEKESVGSDRTDRRADQDSHTAKLLDETTQAKGWMSLREVKNAIDQGDSNGALRALTTVPAEQRDWEWWYMRRTFDGSLFALIGHEETVTQIAFSPDGTKLISASKDKTVRIWDVRTGLELRVLRGHTSRILGLAVSPTGNLIASCAEDSTIRLWDPRDGRELACCSGAGAIIDAVAISPDGMTVASGDRLGSLTFWSAPTGRKLRTLPSSAGEIRSIAFCPTGVVLATAHLGGQIVFRQTNTGETLRTMRADDAAHVPDQPELLAAQQRKEEHINMAFTADGRHFAVGSSKGHSQLWRLDQNYLPGETQWENAPNSNTIGCTFSLSQDGSRFCSSAEGEFITVRELATNLVIGKTPRMLWGMPWNLTFSPDGRFIACAFLDRSIRLWNASDLTHQNGLKCVNGRNKAQSISFAPDGRRFATLSEGNQVCIWNAEQGLKIRTFKITGAPIWQLLFHPSADVIATCGEELAIRDAASGNIHASLTLDSAAICVAFSPDGQWLASGHLDHTVRLWHPTSGTRHILKGHANAISSLSFRSDGAQLASAGLDETVRIWDLRTLRETQKLSLFVAGVRRCLAYHPTSPELAIGYGNSILIWNPASPNPGQELKGHLDYLISLRWRPDGRTLVSGNRDGAIQIWNVVTGRETFDLRGSPRRKFGQIDINPANHDLASLGEDGTVNVWHSSKNLALVEMEAGQRAIHCIALSADGQRLASGGEDQTIRLWDTRTGDQLRVWQLDRPIMNVRFQDDVPVDATDPAELRDNKTKKEAIVTRRNQALRSKDGSIFAQFTNQAIRVFRPPNEQELAYRRWATRPDPLWHVEQREKFEKQGNTLAAHFHRVAEERAQAVVSLEEGHPVEAYWHRVAALVLQSSKPR